MVDLSKNLQHSFDLGLTGHKFVNVNEDNYPLIDDHKYIIDYFEKKTEGKRLASRKDLNPSEITPHLPNITMFDIEKDDGGSINSINIRLIGTSLSSFFGEITGRNLLEKIGDQSLSKIYPGAFKRIVSLIDAINDKKTPFIMNNEQISVDRPNVLISSLAIPFSDDGENVNMAFFHSDIKRTLP